MPNKWNKLRAKVEADLAWDKHAHYDRTFYFQYINNLLAYMDKLEAEDPTHEKRMSDFISREGDYTFMDDEIQGLS